MCCNFKMNPFLRLIKQDLLEYAVKNNGLIHKEVIESLLVNLNYQDIFNIYYQEEFSFKNILKKCFFISVLDKNNAKKLGFVAKDKKEADYFFQEAWDICQKEKILNAFYENGLDPYLFIKTAISNIKRTKNGYVFKDFEEIIKKYVEDLDIDEIKKSLIKNQQIFLQDERNVILSEENSEKKNLIKNELTIFNKDLSSNHQVEKELTAYGEKDFYEWLIDDNIGDERIPLHENALIEDDVNFIEYIHYDSCLLLNRNKVEKALNFEESKSTWYDLQQMLMNEGMDLKRANAQIAKLMKEEKLLDVFDALKKIKQRKNTPTSVIGAIKSIIEENRVDKFNQFSITSYFS